MKGHSQVRKHADFKSLPTFIIYITFYSNRGMQVVIIKVSGKAHRNCVKKGGGGGGGAPEKVGNQNNDRQKKMMYLNLLLNSTSYSVVKVGHLTC